MSKGAVKVILCATAVALPLLNASWRRHAVAGAKWLAFAAALMGFLLCSQVCKESFLPMNWTSGQDGSRYGLITTCQAFFPYRTADNVFAHAGKPMAQVHETSQVFVDLDAVIY